MTTRTTLVALALAALLALPAAARADGAIAKSEDGYTGLSYNYRGPRAADERALEECQGRCRIVLRFRGECAAVAVGRSGGGGWARGERMARAEEGALEQCRAQGNRECRIQQRGCDDR